MTSAIGTLLLAALALWAAPLQAQTQAQAQGQTQSQAQAQTQAQTQAQAQAQAQASSVVVDKSEIRFFSKQLGVVVEGRFRKWTADLDFRPDDPARSRVAFTIDLGSIDFASDEAEAEMKRPGWFDTVKFPTATFVSTSVKDLGGDRYEVAGRFTLKGQTQDLVVPVRLAKETGGAAVARGEFTLKRIQFMVGDGPWNDTNVVADDVLVRVRMTLSRTVATAQQR